MGQESRLAKLTRDILLSLKAKPCFVYVLVDPLTKSPFYIGISNNPWWRFREHCNDKCSAAWPILSKLTGNTYSRDQILKIYKECPDRRTAFDLEYRLVTATPNLLNRPYVRGRAYA